MLLPHVSVSGESETMSKQPFREGGFKAHSKAAPWTPRRSISRNHYKEELGGGCYCTKSEGDRSTEPVSRSRSEPSVSLGRSR